MKNNIFDFQSYKIYLQVQLAGKGNKGKFSDSIGCQPSFLSQVLRGQPHLSLEQGLLATEFFGHSTQERQHFLLLLQHERAGSHRLREYFQREIESSLSERKTIAKRVTQAKESSQSARNVYYSSWLYSAIHVLSSLPHDDQIQLLLDKSGLNRKRLNEVLRFLTEEGMVVATKEGYRPGHNRTHIPDHDPLVLNHHRNFRARTLEELKYHNEENLHYSLIMAMSRADGHKIKEMILQLIENTDKILRPSREEQAFQFCIDFFEV